MHRIILDIDSVGDDILAVIFGLLNEKINIEAITTVVGASGDIEQATWVALNTVELTENIVPVYSGASKAMVEPDFSQGDPVNFHEVLYDKLGDRLNRFNEEQQKPKYKQEKEHAVDFIINTVKNNPHEMTLVTTGPLTNIGLALEKDPSIAPLIKDMYVLGGNFNIAGNITPLSEYNMWADPEAAKIVFNADIKEITLVPLDVCENNDFADSMLTRDDLYDMKTYGKEDDRVIDYVTNKFPVYIDIWREFFDLKGFPMDDIITLALVAYPELCEYTEKTYVDVELEGELARGALVPFFGRQILHNENKEKRNVKIAKTVDGKKFMTLFNNTIINNSLK